MTESFTVQTEAALVESILARGFDPDVPVGRDDFLRLLADAEAIDTAGRDALPPAIGSMREQFGQTGAVLTLPIAVGHLWLDRLLTTSPVTLEERAIADAIVTLVRRLVPVLQQVVTFEANVLRSARGIAGDESADDGDQALLQPWLDRWRLFPVLASLVTLTLVQWFRATEEMLRALEQDHADLATTLTGGSTPLTIHAIQGDAGDPHLGGRSVMIVTFADGARAVFKPKQLAVADVFRALVDRVNAAGFDPPLRLHAAMVRDDHTWESFVPHRPCADTAEVERYYRRMGSWIRLLQALEGRDFWLDNLIADGEYPIFIDLETIMQPRRRGTALSAAAGGVQDRLESSPLVTNIVAMPVPIGPGIEGEDLGCFAAPKDFLSPFPATEIPGVTPPGPGQDGYRTWTHPEHAPVLDGRPVAADAWFPAIERGYRDMAATLDALSPELLARGGLVDTLSRHPVRTIFRDTWTCIRIIHRSTAPPLLGSQHRRRQFLERMGRQSAEDAARTGPVIAAEVRAMLALDVPFFSALGVDDAIHPPDGSRIPAFFQGTARDQVGANLRPPTPHRLEEDVALLRTGFWTTHRATPVPAAPSSPVDEPIASAAWAVAANRILDGIAASLVPADDGTSSWLALTYHPTIDVESLSPLGHDLLSGRAGVVTCLVDQWRATGEDRWRDLASWQAHELVGTLRGAIGALQGGTPDDSAPKPDTQVLLGAFTGLGGMLAAIELAADALGDAALDAASREAMDCIDWDAVLSRSEQDVVGGRIGLGLALTARPEWVRRLPAGLRASLDALAFEELQPEPARSPSARARLSAVPGSAVGQLLLRAGLAGGDGADPRETIATVLGTNPSVGDLLGMVELSRPEVSWWPHLALQADRAFETCSEASGRGGQIDAAEVALAMWRATGDACWRGRAHALGERWIDAFNASGSWFPADLADDRFRLSPITGVPAIASVLRRLNGNPVLAGPRTLNWREWSAR